MKVNLVSDSDGWKTYTNREWGIKFRFEDKENQYKAYSEDSFIDVLYLNGLSGPLYLHRGSLSDFSPVAIDLEEYITKYAWREIENAIKLEEYKKFEINKNINAYELDILSRGVQHPINVPDTYSIFTIYYLEYTKFNTFDYISIFGETELVDRVLKSFEYID